MSDYTTQEVLDALATKFISDERLYEEIGWDYYEQRSETPGYTKSDHVKLYFEENEYAEPEYLLDWSELAYDLREGSYWLKQDGNTNTVVLRGEEVPVVCVQQLGGMDEGTTADVTFKVGEQYFTKRGWYQSHYGYEYDGDFEETVPVQKLEYDYVRKS